MKKILLFITLAVPIFFIACDKELSIPERFTPIGEGNTNIKFLNLSPGSPQLNFYLNGTKTSAFNPTSAGAEVGMAYNGFYPATIGYTTTPAGSIKLEAIVTPTSTVMPGATLISTTQTFAANKFYTVALVDTFTQAKIVVLEDDPSVADMTKAYYRVANFLATKPVKVEVVRTSTGDPFSKVYNNIAPQTAIPFDPMDAGSGQVYKIYLRDVNTDAKLDSVSNFAPSLTKKYTFYVRGGQATTGTTRPIISYYTTF